MIVLMRVPVALLMLVMTVTGCSTLLALDQASQTLEIYELRTPDIPDMAARRKAEVVVEQPIASGALATERIMIRPAPLQAQYLPGVRWADTAPVMVQTLLVRSLAQTGALGTAGRRPVGADGDFTVLSELTDFQIEARQDGSDPVVRVRLILRMVREDDSRIVATRTFETTETAASTDADTVVVAFNLATSRLLGDAVPWVVGKVW